MNGGHDAIKTLAPSKNKLAVHIDTSLQIEQQKVEEKAAPVRIALSQYVFSSTSTYARKEFKRAWLKDLGLIYKLCEDCRSIAEVYQKVNRSTQVPQAKRRRDRCMDAMFAFLSKLDPTEISMANAVPRLRALLAETILGAYPKWERSVTHQYDGTGCVRSAERPTRDDNGAIDVKVRECKPSKIQCNVHKFYEMNITSFQKIAGAVTGKSSLELQKTKSTIAAASKNSTILCDSSNCSAMSDALIAIDGMAADHFAANNPKEWETIAAALDKPLVNPVARK